MFLLSGVLTSMTGCGAEAANTVQESEVSAVESSETIDAVQELEAEQTGIPSNIKIINRDLDSETGNFLYLR